MFRRQLRLQLLLYIGLLLPFFQLCAQESNKPTFVGSEQCRRCHEKIYAGWSQTRMANVVRDPREHPEAIIGDFSKPDPLVTFLTNDIAFVYGQKWKQRYFKRVGNDYYPLPAQWDVAHKIWRPYFVKDDWWV